MENTTYKLWAITHNSINGYDRGHSNGKGAKVFCSRSHLIPAEALSWPLLVHCTHSASAGIAGVDLVWLLKSNMNAKLHYSNTRMSSHFSCILSLKTKSLSLAYKATLGSFCSCSSDFCTRLVVSGPVTLVLWSWNLLYSHFTSSQ